MKYSIVFFQALLAAVMAAPVSQGGSDGVRVSDNGDFVFRNSQEDHFIAPKGADQRVLHNRYGVSLEEIAASPVPASSSANTSVVPTQTPTQTPAQRGEAPYWDDYYGEYHNGRPYYGQPYYGAPNYGAPNYGQPYYDVPPSAPIPTQLPTTSAEPTSGAVSTTTVIAPAATALPVGSEGPHHVPAEYPPWVPSFQEPYEVRRPHFEEIPFEGRPYDEYKYEPCAPRYYYPEPLHLPQAQAPCGLSGCLKWLKCPFSKLGSGSSCVGGNCVGGGCVGGNCIASGHGAEKPCVLPCQKTSQHYCSEPAHNVVYEVPRRPHYYVEAPQREQRIPQPAPIVRSRPETYVPTVEHRYPLVEPRRPYEVQAEPLRVTEPFRIPVEPLRIPAEPLRIPAEPLRIPLKSCSAPAPEPHYVRPEYYYPEPHCEGAACGSQCGSHLSSLICPWKFLPKPCSGAGCNEAPQVYTQHGLC